MSIPITRHFSLHEFECKDGTPYPAEKIQTHLHPLCLAMEIVREACGGRPVEVVSGYRTPAWNAKKGGAPRSRHVEGDAVDFKVRGMTPFQVHDVVLDLVKAKKIRLGGLGLYPSWVHIDTRPRPSNRRMARWSGSGFGSEVA